MDVPAPPATRRPRADALRNRERLLAAAKAVFSEGGGAGLDAVAQRAGVGIGTRYRHFPTREALYEAVYRREVDQLAELSRRLAEERGSALDGLRRWIAALVGLVATKKGMAAALALAGHKPPELMAYTTGRLHEAIGALLTPAITAGEARPDIDPEDVLRTVIGICLMGDAPGWQAQVMRLLNVFLDGLRPREPARPGAEPVSDGR